jgi:hypothetical protein
MELAGSSGQMVLHMKDNSWITTYMVKEYMCGQIIDVMRDNGKTIRCMVLVCSHGLMAASMKEIIMMIRSRVKEYLPGLTIEGMMETGTMASSMEKASTRHLREKSKEESGKTARGPDGLQREDSSSEDRHCSHILH